MIDTESEVRTPCAYCGEMMSPGRGMSLHVRACVKRPIVGASLEDRLRARAATRLDSLEARLRTVEMNNEEATHGVIAEMRLALAELDAYRDDLALLEGRVS